MTSEEITKTLKALVELQRRMDGVMCQRIFNDDGHIWGEFVRNNHQFPLWKFSGDTYEKLSKHLKTIHLNK